MVIHWILSETPQNLLNSAHYDTHVSRRAGQPSGRGA
jgi:hypothetical protein